MKRLLIALAVLAFAGVLVAQGINTNSQSSASRAGGVYVAYNYSRWTDVVASGPVAAASPASIVLRSSTVTLPDGRTVVPFFVGEIVNVGTGAAQEAVTLTAVSGCYLGAQNNSCTISGNTSNAHGQGDIVASGTGGAYEAAYNANQNSGGLVVVDGSFTGSSTNVAGARALYANVGVNDTRSGQSTPSRLVSAIGTGVCSAGTTLYLVGLGSTTNVCTNTTATMITALADRSGTLRSLSCTATAGGANASSGVVTVGTAPLSTGTYSDSTITATFGTGTTASDTTHTAAVTVGQPIRFKITTQGGETLAGVQCTLELQ